MSRGRGAQGGALRAVAVLTGAELRRLLRTGSVYAVVLLPSLLLIPVALLIGTLALSFVDQRDVVALPWALPPELGVVEGLEAADWRVVQVGDPAASLDAGDVAVAVLSWETREGIGTAGRFDLASRARWRFVVDGDDEAVVSTLRADLDALGNAWLEDAVAAAGGVPDRDLWVAQLDSMKLDAAEPQLMDPVRGWRAYVIFLLGSVAFFFLSLTGVADRRQGVTETLSVLPVSRQAMLWARLLALFSLQVMATVGLGVNFLLLLASIAADRHLDLPSGWAWLSLAGAVLLSDALYSVIAVVAPSAKAANNGSSAVMLVLAALLGLGVFVDGAWWVPLAGGVSALGPLQNGVALLSSLLATAAVVWGCARALDRRVDLVLKGAEG